SMDWQTWCRTPRSTGSLPPSTTGQKDGRSPHQVSQGTSLFGLFAATAARAIEKHSPAAAGVMAMKNRTAWTRAALLLPLLMTGAGWVLFAMSVPGVTSTSMDATVTPLLSKDLAHTAGKELLMLTVEYPPGGSDPAHMHHAQALVYVLEGS